MVTSVDLAHAHADAFDIAALQAVSFAHTLPDDAAAAVMKFAEILAVAADNMRTTVRRSMQ